MLQNQFQGNVCNSDSFSRWNWTVLYCTKLRGSWCGTKKLKEFNQPGSQKWHRLARVQDIYGIVNCVSALIVQFVHLWTTVLLDSWSESEKVHTLEKHFMGLWFFLKFTYFSSSPLIVGYCCYNKFQYHHCTSGIISHSTIKQILLLNIFRLAYRNSNLVGFYPIRSGVC